MSDPVPAVKVYGKLWPGPHQKLPAADLAELTVASEVDPRPHMPGALNQGAIGSCTANATARSFRYDTIMDGHDSTELSRVWIYHFEKALEHTLGQGDTGAIGHDAYTVALHGIPSEKQYPYSEDIEVVERKPPACWPRAYWLKKAVHAVPQDESSIKQVLSNNQTIAFGFVVYENFENETWWSSGEMPSGQGGVLGGHEVLACGYLKAHPNHVLCLNSWGTEFGISGGYFLMPWSSFLDPEATSDLRTIVRPLK